MNGLLDNPADVGLLSMGLRLLSTPGKFGQAFGQAGLGAMGDVQQAKAQQDLRKQRALAEQMQMMQLEQIKRQQRMQAEQEQRDNAFRSAIPSPLGQANAQAAQAGPLGSMAAAAAQPPVDPQARLMYEAMQQRQISPLDYIKATQKDSTPLKLSASERLVDPRTLKTLVDAAPDKAAQDKDIELLKMLYGEGTPQYMAALKQLASKRTTHAPAATAISYGSPVPVQFADGTIGYAQPGNKAGAAPQIMAGPDGKPLKKPGEDEKALTEGQAKALAFAARMAASDQTLSTLAQKGVRTTLPGSMGNNTAGAVMTALSSSEQQQLAQAKRDFINATLRRESGAVIGADEFANGDRQYFPQIGDSPAVIAQKARNRRIAIEGIKADVPLKRRAEVDGIAGAGSAPGPDNDPLGLRR